MFAKEKLHGTGLVKKCSALLLCLLFVFSWATAGAESEVLMYAADGRTLSVNSSEVEAYKAVGWYTEPFVLMYAADGRTLNVNSAETEAYKAVGWYTEPVTLMYAADGRTLYVINSEVEAYKAVGWYTEPVTLMYAADGRTLYVINSEVEAYKAVGWYTTRQAAASAFPDLSGYGSGSSVSSQPVSGTVYRGRSGTKYHRATCPTLKRGGAYPMSLSEALSRGRTACKVCKP